MYENQAAAAQAQMSQGNGLRGGAVAVEKVEKRLRELPMSTMGLETTVSGLEAAVEKLEARLAPVRSASPETLRSGGEKNVGFGCQAAAAVAGQTERIQRVISRLHQLEASLEV